MRKELSKPSVRTRAVRSLAVAEPVVNAADAKGTNVNDKVTASDFKLEKLHLTLTKVVTHLWRQILK
ncbi:hypothetical protein UM582_06685 [Staphylococcus aureus]|nr:hypothetical protein UM582_06685 [Staphylococcus aureus]